MKKIKNNLNFIIPVIIVLSVVYVVPLFLNGIMGGDDLLYHLTRFKSLCNQFKLGNFHPLIYPEMLNEYGYASGIFYPDYLFYPFALLNLIGIKTYYCFALYYIFVNVCTGLSFFFCSRAIFRDYDKINYNFKAFVIFIFSLLDLYKFRNYYGRAAVGEFTAMIFVPIVVLGMYHIINFGKKSYILALGMTGILACHILSFVMACMVLFIVSLYNIKKLVKAPYKLAMIGLAALQCMLLSAFIWVPMIEAMIKCDLTISHGTDLFLRPIWDNYLFTFGGNKIVGTIIICVVIFCSIFLKSPGHRLLQIITFSAVFLSDCFPWQVIAKIKPIVSIQFPWRFLSVFYFAVLYYLYLYILNVDPIDKSSKFKKVKKALIILMSVLYLLLISSASLLSSGLNEKVKLYEKDIDRVNNVGFLEYAPYNFSLYNKNHTSTYIDNCYSSDELASVNYSLTELNNDKITEVEKEITKSGYNVKYATENEELVLPIINYPGYKIYINNEEIKNIKTDKYGFIKIRNIPNEGIMDVIYKGTVFQYFSFIISGISILLLIFVFFLKNSNKKRLS